MTKTDYACKLHNPALTRICLSIIFTRKRRNAKNRLCLSVCPLPIYSDGRGLKEYCREERLNYIAFSKWLRVQNLKVTSAPSTPSKPKLAPMEIIGSPLEEKKNDEPINHLSDALHISSICITFSEGMRIQKYNTCIEWVQELFKKLSS